MWIWAGVSRNSISSRLEPCKYSQIYKIVSARLLSVKVAVKMQDTSVKVGHGFGNEKVIL